jgi:poly(A) polymerase
MLLRCESGEVDEELGKWWEAFQHAGSRERETMLISDESQKKRRRSRSRKKSGVAHTGESGRAASEKPEGFTP